MPFDLRLDSESDVIRIDLRGDLTGSDLLDAIIKARDITANGRLQLWDAREVASVQIDPDVLDSLHELMKLRIEHGVEIRGKRALITCSHDIASIAEILADEFAGFGVEIRVFADEPVALHWLAGR